MPSIQGYMHKSAPDQVFLPTKAPEEIEVGDEVTIRQAARALGVDAAALRALIEDGQLETVRDDDSAIAGKSFARFLGGLEAVELVPKATSEAPRSSRGRLALNEDEGEHPSEWEADCPGCGERLLIADGVEKFRCPSCNRSIIVAEQASEEKSKERNPRRHVHVRRAR